MQDHIRIIISGGYRLAASYLENTEWQDNAWRIKAGRIKAGGYRLPESYLIEASIIIFGL